VAVGLLALVTGVPLVCQGRVFLRLGRWFLPSLTEGVAGGKLVYEAPLWINGAPARVAVLECPMAAASLAGAMGAAVPTAGAGVAGGEPVRIWEQAGAERCVRWVAVTPRGRPGCVLFGIEQEAERAAVARVAGAEQPVPGLSALPGARTTFTALNEETRTALTIVRVKGAARSLVAGVEAELRQQGWQPAPAGARRPAGGMFVRGREICCLWVRGGAADGECLVALLHKQTRW